MPKAGGVLTLLTVGLAGGILFTVFTHPDGVKALFSGLDSLYKTAGALTVGQVA